MQVKNLGSQGLKASQLGLGCMGMSEFYGPGNDEQSLKTLERALELGVSFWDTSDAYGPFKNEELLSKALLHNRSRVTLATKFGIVRDINDPQARSLNGKPAYVRQACEASLKRLGTDYIDLYYLHRVDPATPVEETVGAMADLVKEGKIKGIGLSEVSAATLRRVHTDVYPVTAIQNEYSLWSREPEEGVLQACEELNIAFVAYSPLGRGFLTGRIKSHDDFAPDDYRRMSPRFQKENFQKNIELVKKVEELAHKKNCSASQLALAWVIAPSENIFPIPGTKQIKYLEENVDALRVSLNREELDAIDELFPKDAAAGQRYPPQMMRLINN